MAKERPSWFDGLSEKDAKELAESIEAWHKEHPDNGKYGMRYDEADEDDGSFVLY